MSIISFTYNQLLRSYEASSGLPHLVTRAILGVFVKIFSSLVDPEVEVRIRGKYLHMPLSHRLPIFAIDYSFYDELPTRVSRYLREKYGYLNLIDVGANIGDTVLACFDEEESGNDRFLAIEANPGFVRYLRKNCNRIDNLRFLEVYCGSTDKEVEIKIEASKGTAAISETEGGHRIDKKTIDSIVDEMGDYREFNLLKIDTDGDDFQVIQGARRSISRNHPAVLFECNASANIRYVEEFVETTSLFARSGYSKAIVYDNFGLIFSLFDFNKVAEFKYALIYQLISGFHYFDLLVMKDEDVIPFLDREIKYFVDKAPSSSLQRMVKAAASL